MTSTPPPAERCLVCRSQRFAEACCIDCGYSEPKSAEPYREQSQTAMSGTFYESAEPAASEPYDPYIVPGMSKPAAIIGPCVTCGECMTACKCGKPAKAPQSELSPIETNNDELISLKRTNTAKAEVRPAQTAQPQRWHAVFADHRDTSRGVLQEQPWGGGSNMTATFEVVCAWRFDQLKTDYDAVCAKYDELVSYLPKVPTESYEKRMAKEIAKLKADNERLRAACKRNPSSGSCIEALSRKADT